MRSRAAADGTDIVLIGSLVYVGHTAGRLRSAFLGIVSNQELSVSAVYTANPINGGGISIDVEYIPPRRLDLRPRK